MAWGVNRFRVAKVGRHGLEDRPQHSYEKSSVLNERWVRELFNFFNLAMPHTFQEWAAFRQTIDVHRAAYGASWMSLPVHQALAAEMQQLVAALNQVKLQFDRRLKEVYGHLLVTEEMFGDQRAKTLIDMTEGAFKPEDAIPLLEMALEYGQSGIQASKAYLGLGMRYEELGELELAIENYTSSMDAYKPFSIALFWRGRLYFEQGKWEEARADFEQAISFEDLFSPEREEAEQFLAELDKRLQ